MQNTHQERTDPARPGRARSQALFRQAWERRLRAMAPAASMLQRAMLQACLSAGSGDSFPPATSRG